MDFFHKHNMHELWIFKSNLTMEKNLQKNIKILRIENKNLLTTLNKLYQKSINNKQ